MFIPVIFYIFAVKNKIMDNEIIDKKYFDQWYKNVIVFLKENNCYHSFMYCFKRRREVAMYLPGPKVMLMDKDCTFHEYCESLFLNKHKSDLFIYAFKWSSTNEIIKVDGYTYWWEISRKWMTFNSEWVKIFKKTL